MKLPKLYFLFGSCAHSDPPLASSTNLSLTQADHSFQKKHHTSYVLFLTCEESSSAMLYHCQCIKGGTVSLRNFSPQSNPSSPWSWLEYNIKAAGAIWMGFCSCITENRRDDQLALGRQKILTLCLSLSSLLMYVLLVVSWLVQFPSVSTTLKNISFDSPYAISKLKFFAFLNNSDYSSTLSLLTFLMLLHKWWRFLALLLFHLSPFTFFLQLSWSR